MLTKQGLKKLLAPLITSNISDSNTLKIFSELIKDFTEKETALSKYYQGFDSPEDTFELKESTNKDDYKQKYEELDKQYNQLKLDYTNAFFSSTETNNNKPIEPDLTTLDDLFKDI